MITAYLTFDGDAEEAFSYYRSVLGGELTSLHRFGDSPFGAQLPDADKRKLMHVTLESPHGTIRGNDHLEMMGPLTPGNTMALSLHPRSEEAARELFEGLSADGMVTVPLDNAPWGALFGMLNDRFGVRWLVNFEHPNAGDEDASQGPS
jgi:PhnB protein